MTAVKTSTNPTKNDNTGFGFVSCVDHNSEDKRDIIIIIFILVTLTYIKLISTSFILL